MFLMNPLKTEVTSPSTLSLKSAQVLPLSMFSMSTPEKLGRSNTVVFVGYASLVESSTRLVRGFWKGFRKFLKRFWKFFGRFFASF